MTIGWHYKGTKNHVKLGDKVLISVRLAKENNVERNAEVVGLAGFISVKLSDGQVMDVDARSMTQCGRKLKFCDDTTLKGNEMIQHILTVNSGALRPKSFHNGVNCTNIRLPVVLTDEPKIKHNGTTLVTVLDYFGSKHVVDEFYLDTVEVVDGN